MQARYTKRHSTQAMRRPRRPKSFSLGSKKSPDFAERTFAEARPFASTGMIRQSSALATPLGHPILWVGVTQRHDHLWTSASAPGFTKHVSERRWASTARVVAQAAHFLENRAAKCLTRRNNCRRMIAKQVCHAYLADVRSPKFSAARTGCLDDG